MHQISGENKAYQEYKKQHARLMGKVRYKEINLKRYTFVQLYG